MADIPHSPPATPGRGRRRALQSVQGLPRSPLGSQYHRKLDKMGVSARAPLLHRLKIFLPGNWFAWGWEYFKNRIGFRHPFPCYDLSPGSADRGVYRLEDLSSIGGRPDPAGEVRVSLAGDWGTGTQEAERVAEIIRGFDPHFTLHLGDVYYVGGREEVESNCLGAASDGYQGVRWPLGSVGSFSLNGNHEMYARGFGYFDVLLPKMGLRPAPGHPPQGQHTSYFCLENDFWRVLALDTGYNSISFPIVEDLVEPSSKLRAEEVQWVKDVVQPTRDKRGLILLTHHQYYSDFEGRFVSPARQLAPFIDRPLIWYWGHEHRLAIYGLYGGPELHAWGRCVGHGGMANERKPPARRECGLVLYDDRPYPPLPEVTYNGLLNLRFQGPTLHVDYRDVDSTQLLTESWSVDLATGKLDGPGLANIHPQLSR
jgi:calcineurin-like phosphoesterase family protein